MQIPLTNYKSCYVDMEDTQLSEEEACEFTQQLKTKNEIEKKNWPKPKHPHFLGGMC